MDWTGGFTTGFTVKLVQFPNWDQIWLRPNIWAAGEGWGGEKIWMRGAGSSTGRNLLLPLGTRLYKGGTFMSDCMAKWYFFDLAKLHLSWSSNIWPGKAIFHLVTNIWPGQKNRPGQTLNDSVKIYLTWPRKYLTWLVRVMQAIMWFLVWGSFAIRRIILLLLTKWWMNKPMVSRVQTGKVCLAILSFKMIVS